MDGVHFELPFGVKSVITTTSVTSLSRTTFADTFSSPSVVIPAFSVRGSIGKGRRNSLDKEAESLPSRLSSFRSALTNNRSLPFNCTMTSSAWKTRPTSASRCSVLIPSSDNFTTGVLSGSSLCESSSPPGGASTLSGASITRRPSTSVQIR